MSRLKRHSLKAQYRRHIKWTNVSIFQSCCWSEEHENDDSPSSGWFRPEINDPNGQSPVSDENKSSSVSNKSSFPYSSCFPPSSHENPSEETLITLLLLEDKKSALKHSNLSLWGAGGPSTVCSNFGLCFFLFFVLHCLMFRDSTDSSLRFGGFEGGGINTGRNWRDDLPLSIHNAAVMARCLSPGRNSDARGSVTSNGAWSPNRFRRRSELTPLLLLLETLDIAQYTATMNHTCSEFVDASLVIISRNKECVCSSLIYWWLRCDITYKWFRFHELCSIHEHRGSDSLLKVAELKGKIVWQQLTKIQILEQLQSVALKCSLLISKRDTNNEWLNFKEAKLHLELYSTIQKQQTDDKKLLILHQEQTR